MKKIYFALVLGLYLSACSEKEETDTAKPEVKHLEIAGKDLAVHDDHGHDHEHESIELNADSSYEIHYELEDNIALGEIRMDIHDDFDGHKHGKKGSIDPFSWERIIKLDGQKTADGKIMLDIPADVLAGPYHFDAILLDQAGNQSDQVIGDLFIKTPDMAQIMLKSTVAPISITRGTSADLNIELTDDTGLAELEVVIYQEGNTPVFDYDKTFTPMTLNDVLNIPVNLSSGISAGEYELKIKVIDSDGNITQEYWEITVK